MSLVSFATKTPFVKRLATFCKNNKKLLVGTGLGFGTIGLIGIGAKKTEKESVEAMKRWYLTNPMYNPHGWIYHLDPRKEAPSNPLDIAYIYSESKKNSKQVNKAPDDAKNVYVA